MDLKQTDQAYVTGSYSKYDLALKEGCGSILTDYEGKRYIDFGSGIAVNIFGACDQVWIDAVEAQLHRIAHTSNLYYTAPQAELARLLCEKTGMKNAFFCNSGAEANEGAIKAARKYAHDKYGEQRSKIVTLKHSFHGRTMGALSATGQDSLHQHFGPFLPGFSYAEADNIEESLSHLTDDCAAFMVELIQGEGGMKVLSQDYIKALYQACQEKDILFVVDEVQTGNGRTGRMYCYENYGILPDLVATAKGLGGGLPIGAVLFGEKVKNTITPGTHGSTFGGNPVCAAGAISIVERLDDALFAEVAEKGAWLLSALKEMDGIEQADGLGLMIGAKTTKPVAEIIQGCMAEGLLVLSAKDRLRLLPALNIPMAQLEEGAAILKQVLKA